MVFSFPNGECDCILLFIAQYARYVRLQVFMESIENCLSERHSLAVIFSLHFLHLLLFVKPIATFYLSLWFFIQCSSVYFFLVGVSILAHSSVLMWSVLSLFFRFVFFVRKPLSQLRPNYCLDWWSESFDIRMPLFHHYYSFIENFSLCFIQRTMRSLTHVYGMVFNMLSEWRIELSASLFILDCKYTPTWLLNDAIKLHSNRKSTNIRTIGKRRCIDKSTILNLSAKKPL